jgi:alpha-mannosidase
VKTGRWEIVGGWLIEPDCNLPTAKSFYKSAELSKKFIGDKFGVDVPIAFCPDSFGHAATLPKILSDTGFKYYIFQRPNSVEKADLPNDLFYWEYEGSRVLCYRLRHGYTQGRSFNIDWANSAFADEDFLKNGLAGYFFGVGDHGGGPTKCEIDALIQRQKELSDPTLTFSTCLQFFKEAEKLPNIPVYSGDLHMHAIGCYSVNRELKHSIRTAERLLGYTARVMDAAGVPENGMLDTLWEKVIFNQFHDIMPGSCAPVAARQVLHEVGGVLADCGDTSYEALKKISAKLPVKCPQGEFRIFNSLNEPVTAPFQIESFMYYAPGATFKDGEGNAIDIQEITPSVSCFSRRGSFVDTIPARSAKTYYFDSSEVTPIAKNDQYFLEEGAEVSAKKFTLRAPGQIIDRENGKPFFVTSPRLGIVRDSSDTWSHGLRGYGTAERFLEKAASYVHRGPVASILHTRHFGSVSEAHMTFTAYRDLPFIDLEILVHWREKQSILKLEIEPDGGIDSLLVQAPGAAVKKRTNKAEEPLHGWMLTGSLGIMQDGAFAFDRQGNKIRITLIRSSLYGYDFNSPFDPNGPLNYTDIGEHRFRLRFVRKSGLNAEEMDRMCEEFIEPFYVLREGIKTEGKQKACKSVLMFA